MSAPDPKEWEEPDDDPEILAFAYRIARRRAIAELQALSELCEQTQTLDGDFWTVDSAVIHNRIAAIAAEDK